jgi:hypothetical protein
MMSELSHTMRIQRSDYSRNFLASVIRNFLFLLALGAIMEA